MTQEVPSAGAEAAGRVLRVAVPGPFPEPLDYAPPPEASPELLRPGVRLRVPLGRRRVVGVLVGAGPSRVAPERLRPALELLDPDGPVLPPDVLELALWAARYYRHPPGETLAAALPVLLRRGAAARSRRRRWRPAPGAAAALAGLARTPRRRRVLELLLRHPEGLEEAALAQALARTGGMGRWREALRALAAAGLVELAGPASPPAGVPSLEAGPALYPEQEVAVEAVRATLEGRERAGAPGAFLLEGVTGSGKTEVYLHLAAEALARGRQVLVLVPEIGLTPQLVDRFRRRLPAPVVVLHSGMGDRERLEAWLQARSGEAGVVLGTRSAVFAPLARPGLVVVDEEHDPSFKQQEGLRYHARDLAVWRARRLGVPALLGSATPSLESLHNVLRGRYRHLRLPRRAGGARPPRTAVLDLRRQPMEGLLSRALLEAVARHLQAGGQVLLFLNRRGYAPTLLCHTCGWVAACGRCDAHLVAHQAAGRLRCHHCGAERPLPGCCPACGGVELLALGHGTERVEQALARRFPGERVVRIDRDSTRRRGSLERALAAARSGEARILLGTQMLAKGHHLPGVTLAAVLDADQGLFSPDFRGPERMAQLLVQVAGRAGRAERPGEVLVQTHHPEHPLLQRLLREGYPGFAREALAERREAGLPPWTRQALLRVEAVRREAAWAFAERAAAGARALVERGEVGEVEVLGPAPAPMERRAGRHRVQLLLQAPARGPLHRLLDAWLPALAGLPEGRRARWHLDVDPQEVG